MRLIFEFIVEPARKQDASRNTEAFDAGSQVDAVPIDLRAVEDDVSDMQADSKGYYRFFVIQGSLDSYGAFYSLHPTLKNAEGAVAKILQDLSGVYLVLLGKNGPVAGANFGSLLFILLH